MERGGLEALAMRAVEVVMQKGRDPRLHIATRPRLPGPRKGAGWVAGLLNSAQGRQPVLLLGITASQIRGLAEPPPPSWVDRVTARFRGAVPEVRWCVLDIEGALVMALTAGPVGELVAVEGGDGVYVPWVERNRLQRAPAELGPPPVPRSEAPPSAGVRSGWMEVSTVRQGEIDVDAYRGALELDVDPVTGVIEDAACSATLIVPELDAPVALAVQVHPSREAVGVVRTETGVEIKGRFRVELYMAGAVRSSGSRRRERPLQLAVSLLLPARVVPDVQSLLLAPDPDAPLTRWCL